MNNKQTIRELRALADKLEAEDKPKPEQEFKKGQRVLAWSEYDEARRRYSHYKNGKHYCFKNGGDEYTSGGKTKSWDYVKPDPDAPKEPEEIEGEWWTKDGPLNRSIVWSVGRPEGFMDSVKVRVFLDE